MTTTSRRRVLTALAAVPVAYPGLDRPRPAAAAAAAAAADRYASNSALYADPGLTQGVDYARRHRRHAAFDDSPDTAIPFPTTVVVAPHGGGIETGTSELCLAVAGYHPATLAVTPAGGAVHDYWMFEGLRATGNAELHVTSTHCDDPVARSLCAGARSAVALHGCTAAQAGLAEGTAAVLVGGLDADLGRRLRAAYAAVDIQAVDAATVPALAGDDPRNIVNRTLLGAGAQLELTTPLRAAMFGTNTRPQRRHTTTELFWRFVGATRAALGGGDDGA
jgi:phage replication-related protein YjqB (UPF0714/DUF867 family)